MSPPQTHSKVALRVQSFVSALPLARHGRRSKLASRRRRVSEPTEPGGMRPNGLRAAPGARSTVLPPSLGDNLGDEQETLTERCEIQVPYILYVHMQIVIQSETNNQIAKNSISGTPFGCKSNYEERDKQKGAHFRTSIAACTPTRSRRP